jgi:hypothetical protein
MVGAESTIPTGRHVVGLRNTLAVYTQYHKQGTLTYMKAYVDTWTTKGLLTRTVIFMLPHVKRPNAT